MISLFTRRCFLAAAFLLAGCAVSSKSFYVLTSDGPPPSGGGGPGIGGRRAGASKSGQPADDLLGHRISREIGGQRIEGGKRLFHPRRTDERGEREFHPRGAEIDRAFGIHLIGEPQDRPTGTERRRRSIDMTGDQIELGAGVLLEVPAVQREAPVRAGHRAAGDGVVVR
ncbi:MAG: hypothetical protein KDN05_13650, partial [Verrucomicrobiae bacterium]|nr:hypothetical protein [Verrucomicrobiae bacterium]